MSVNCDRYHPNVLVTTPVAANFATSTVHDHHLLVINANFFSWLGNPHEVPCARAIGLAQDGAHTLSTPGGRVHGWLPDSLIFVQNENGAGMSAIVVRQPANMDEVQLAVGNRAIRAAVSGMLIVREGSPYNQARWADFDGDDEVPRTVVGLRGGDAANLTVLVVEDDHTTAAGATIPMVADFLIAQGISQAMMLDGSGSSALVYRPPMSSPHRPVVTQPYDRYPLGTTTLQYRPVPVNLAFSIDSRSKKEKTAQAVYGDKIPADVSVSLRGPTKTLLGYFRLGPRSEFRVTGGQVAIQPNSAFSIEAGGHLHIGPGSFIQKARPDGHEEDGQ